MTVLLLAVQLFLASPLFSLLHVVVAVPDSRPLRMPVLLLHSFVLALLARAKQLARCVGLVRTPALCVVVCGIFTDADGKMRTAGELAAGGFS